MHDADMGNEVRLPGRDRHTMSATAGQQEAEYEP
jgi:hypothetical protein